MTEPVWLSDELPVALHARLVAEFGGLAGIRDPALLESAMARPRQLAAYGTVGVGMFHLAAAYAAGVIRNHPFIDGNKRVGFMLAYVFLERNGYRLTATEKAATRAVLDLASGVMAEPGFARWLEHNSRRV